jgi:methionine biosynthesis protein MetW
MDCSSIYDVKLQVYAKGANPVILKYLKPNQNVLDVGCNDGTLGYRIKQLFNSKVYGIDISPKAIEIANNNLDKAILADISEDVINLEEKYFDVIIFADILEHLYDPKGALLKMKKYLKRDGYYLLSFPNIAHWFIRLKLLLGKFDYTEQGILDKTHIRFFTLETMEDLLHETGFRIKKIDALRGALIILGFQRLLSKVHLHWLYIGFDNFLTSVWKTMFAQQFVILAVRD